MSDNNISKKVKISLDTINQKTIKTNLTVIIGDSFELTFNIFENGIPKDIKDTSCRFVGIRSDETLFEQTDNIVYGSNKGEVIITPKSTIFNTEGLYVCSLVIEYENETINIQRFSINVDIATVTGEVIESSKNDVQTLARLNRLLDDYNRELVLINSNIVKTKEDVTVIKTDITNINKNIDDVEMDISTTESRIDNLNRIVGAAAVMVDEKTLEIKEKVIEATQKKEELILVTNSSDVINRDLKQTNINANETETRLKETYLSAKDDIEKIKATGHKSIIINENQLSDEGYIWNHGLNSEDIHVNFISLLSNEPMQPNYKILNKNNILIKRTTGQPSIKIIASASYYNREGESTSPLQNTRQLRNYAQFNDDNIRVGYEVNLHGGILSYVGGEYENVTIDEFIPIDASSKYEVLVYQAEDIYISQYSKGIFVGQTRLNNGYRWVYGYNSNIIYSETTYPYTSPSAFSFFTTDASTDSIKISFKCSSYTTSPSYYPNSNTLMIKNAISSIKIIKVSESI